MSRPRVLLVHSQDWLGVSRLPGLFARAGIATTLIAPAGCMAACSRFVDENVVAPRSVEGIVALLRDVVRERGDDFGFIVLADDPLLEAVVAHAHEPWAARCLPVTGDALPILQSKFAFLAAARRHGVPLPHSEIVPAAEAVAAARRAGYPVMIKRSEGSGGTGVRKATCDQDVADALRAFGDAAVNVEEYVDGATGATEVLYDRGRVVCGWSVLKRRQFPLPFGPSCLRQVIDTPELRDAIAACGAATGFHGFAAVCWQYDAASGRVAILEMNPRPGSGMHLAPEPAKLFSEGLRALMDGESSTYRGRPVPAGNLYPMFPQDVQRIIRERDVVSLRTWLPFAGSGRDVPWNDLPLLRAQLRMLVDEEFPAVARAMRALRSHVVLVKERAR